MKDDEQKVRQATATEVFRAEDRVFEGGVNGDHWSNGSQNREHISSDAAVDAALAQKGLRR